MTRSRPLLQVLALALLAAPARAQDAPAPKPSVSFEGTDVFRYALKNYGKLKPVPGDGSLAPDPGKELRIYFGRLPGPKAPDRFAAELRAFVDAGGNVLIASDYDSGPRLRPWGVTISEQSPDAPQYPRYHDVPSCITIPREQMQAHAVFLHVRSGLATNRPGQLHADFGSPLRMLAGKDEFFPRNRWGRDWSSFFYVAATPTDAGPAGRVVVLAGHGLFMNGMMLQEDNSNFNFAVGCVDWLCDGPAGRRTHARLVVDGQPVESFDVSLKPPPMPVPVPTVAMLNHLLHGLERENFFNKLLVGQLGGNRDRLVRLLLVGLTLAVLLYGAKKLLAGRFRPDTAVPLLVGPAAVPPAARPWVQDRLRARLAGNHFAEEARALARDWLRTRAGVPPGGGSMPTAQVHGRWWQRWHLRRLARQVWDLARAEPPAPHTRRRFRRLAHTLAELDRAVQDGRLTFRAPAPRSPPPR